IVPGDIVTMRLGQHANAQEVAALRHAWGLDRPLYVQYFDWLGGVLRGDLGVSAYSKQPVLGLLLGALVPTLELALLGTLLSLLISVPAGIAAALGRGRWVDLVLRMLALIGFCIPRYWLAILLILEFSVR